MRVARRYLITGRVQGVGFRFFAQLAARREGLAGWVRNLPDRRVEVVAEGDADAVERFDDAIRTGPPGARIEHVEVDERYPVAGETEFSIK